MSFVKVRFTVIAIVASAILHVGAQYACVDVSTASTNQIADLCVPFLQGYVSNLYSILLISPCLALHSLYLYFWISLSVFFFFFEHVKVFVNITQQSLDVTKASTLKTVQLAPQDCAIYLTRHFLLLISQLFINLLLWSPSNKSHRVNLPDILSILFSVRPIASSLCSLQVQMHRYNPRMCFIHRRDNRTDGKAYFPSWLWRARWGNRHMA